MKRRVLLRAAVKTALLAGAAAFAGVFVYGLLGPGSLGNDVIDPGGLPSGSARMVSWSGRPVWVVNRSDSQRTALATLAGYVSVPGPGGEPVSVNNPGRSLIPAYGVYLAGTVRDGVLVQYSIDRPAVLETGIPWHGGFVDPGSDAVFDPAGRRYRNTVGPPLAVPPHRLTGAGKFTLGEW